MSNNFAIESATPIIFDKVVIKSPQNPIPIDIKNVVSELNVYEHIDKPYVTAILSFVDGDNVMSALNVSGAETVSIKLTSNTLLSTSVEKEFYIDKVVRTVKGNETNELIVLHLTESINYYSNLQNVNKAYSGSLKFAMSTIAKEFLETDLVSSETNDQMTKLIVPNLTPLNAMSWIKNKMSTEKGYPYYMFSPFNVSGLYLIDLKSMLSRPAINKGKPYTYTESTIPSPNENYDPTSRRRVILDYEVKDTENLYELIDKGFVGANHQFIDITKNEVIEHKQDMNEVVNTLVGDNLLQSNPLFSSEYKFKGKSYNSLQSRHMSQVMSTKAFEGHQSYHESPSEGNYKFNTIQRAMDGLLKKQPLSVRVNGIDFLQTKSNNTIGNKLEIKFPANLNDEGKSTNRFDKKKSGEYLIYAAKHTFQRDDYTVALTCVKLSNGEV